jgi:hypothetical protein
MTRVLNQSDILLIRSDEHEEHLSCAVPRLRPAARTTSWGAPSARASLTPGASRCGHKLYRWFYSKSAAMPATTTGTVTQVGSTSFINATTSGGGVISGNCTRTLEVDERNIVIRSQWEGNNCPFSEAFEYSTWRRKIN